MLDAGKFAGGFAGVKFLPGCLKATAGLARAGELLTVKCNRKISASFSADRLARFCIALAVGPLGFV